MKWMTGLILTMCAVARAADPPAPRAAAASAASSTPVVAPARKPLDLRLGDLRKYMTPEEYRALMAAPAEEANTVVVQADAPLLPMKSEQPVPVGIMAPFWALANPTQAWRLLVPDLKRGPAGPPDPIPPPVFRWGP
jgi:hypothetical protein